MKDADKKLKPYLSPLGAWALAMGTTIGWGSLVVTSNTYLVQAGPLGSVLGLIVGAAVMLVIGRNYSYMMQCYPEAGGAYTFAKEVFGYDYGFLGAWFLCLTYLAIYWANVTSLPLFARYFLGSTFHFGKMYTLFGYDVCAGEVLLSMGAILLFALLCMRFKKLTSAIMIALVVVFTLGIAVCFAAAVFSGSRTFSPAYVPNSKALTQIITIAVISPWAFIGFESISHSSEEFDFNRTKIFPILVAAVIVSTVLYIFVTLLSVTAYPAEYRNWLGYIRDIGNLQGIKAIPAFYAAHHYLGNAGVVLLMTALLALIITSLIGNMTALSRLLYSLAKDKILPGSIGKLNKQSIPSNAILLVAGVSLLIPFAGRTPIGWIVDVTTIGAVILYALVSASTMKLARIREDRVERTTGLLGLVVMVGFGVYELLPNFLSQGSLATETYFLFIIWSVLGFLFFRSILRRDREHRFGQSFIVWVALLCLVLFVALIWMRQSMIASNNLMIHNIRDYYMSTSSISELRLHDEQFIESQMHQLQAANTRTILMTTGMFVFALVIMLTNYSFMNKRSQESEKIINTDPMTGVKSKHAYFSKERELDDAIREGQIHEFAIVVCDVNGLKYINDTYGHKAGDEYIRSASRLVCETFKHSPVYRVGGDEFVAVLTGRDYENRESLMERLNAVSESHIGTDQVIVAGGSSDYRSGEDSLSHEVFKRADGRMYENKQALKSKGSITR